MNLEVVRYAVSIPLAVAGVLVVVRQCRKPAWLPGRLVVRVMNRSHAALTRWGLGHVAIDERSAVLDVGCGGGRTIDTLAGLAKQGRVSGVDYSPASVAESRRTNARGIAEGRIEVRHGSVSELPFPDGAFDLVTAVETHYYWPDLALALREVLRVLRPGGRFVVVAETYRGRRFDWLYRPAMRLLRANYLDLREHRDWLEKAGFVEVEIHEERAHGWITCVGRRP